MLTSPVQWLALSLFTVLVCFSQAADAGQKNNKNQKRSKLPNIIWITCEDIGPDLGCYGDEYSQTPNLDKFAKKAFIYRNAWSNAPVCAPARTTIISGMYPPSTGSHHMRSQTRLPARFQMYVQYLRQRGYFCTNWTKTDYNLNAPGGMWNNSSQKARKLYLKANRPIFAIFNYTTTHESQIRNKNKKRIHDPKKAPIPSYHPDIPEARKDWAQYYDRITQMDAKVGELLRELEEAGLLENTIIFFYGDHGSGMPRHKRHPSNSGLHVPMIVYVPEGLRDLAPDDYRPGGKTDRLVSFVDLAPTLLSLAGKRPPEYYQGSAFMGKYEAKQREFLFGFRGRMDERNDEVRSVRDKRFVYVRNYMPHKPSGQHVNYQFKTPTTARWKQLFDQGKLNKAQSLFWQTKPAEELYDLKNDPDEVINLARMPKYNKTLERFRNAHEQHVFRIRDVGFLPENEIHSRSKNSSPYEVGHDPKKYPLKRIFGMAQLASSMKPGVTEELTNGLKDKDSAVRYWATMGFVMRGKDVVRDNRDVLMTMLRDEAKSVRVAACEALGVYGTEKDAKVALPVLLKLADPRRNDVHLSVMALNVLDAMENRAASAAGEIKNWPKNMKKASDRRATLGVKVLVPRLQERFR
ncbi:MAG: sulfatase-like hydrolase/transferase [Gemmataceae bacterium]